MIIVKEIPVFFVQTVTHKQKILEIETVYKNAPVVELEYTAGLSPSVQY